MLDKIMPLYLTLPKTVRQLQIKMFKLHYSAAGLGIHIITRYLDIPSQDQDHQNHEHQEN